MSKCQDTYKEIKTFEYPNCIVRVHIPDITEQEREYRMRIIQKSAEALLKEVHRIESRKERNEKEK